MSHSRVVVIGRLRTALRLLGSACWRMRSAWLALACLSAGRNFYCEAPARLIGLRYVRIGDDFRAEPGLRLEVFDRHNGVPFSPSVVIGNGVSINFDVHFACVERLEIGNNVLMASHIYISDHHHGTTDPGDMVLPPSARKLHTRGAVVIEDDVWLGEHVCVMPGVRIGKGSIVAAGAIVTRDLPPYSIAAGVPARVLRTVEVPT
jgi:acetyltransferase-like isoleucine patch superfamily enzyme